MRILLTGPTGFIGAAFTRLALSRGHSVAGLIIPSEQVPAHLPPHQSLSWFRGTLDEAPWSDVQQFKPDVCVHTAWVTALVFTVANAFLLRTRIRCENAALRELAAPLPGRVQA